MALVNKTTLKGYFKDQEIITPSMFVDMFDSVLTQHSDTTTTVGGETTFSKGVQISNGTYHTPIKMKTADQPFFSWFGTDQDIEGFIPHGAIPLSLTVKVITSITNNGYITTIGTQDDPNAFCSGIADGVLEQAGDEITCAYIPVSDDSFMNRALTHLSFVINAAGAGDIRVAMVYIDGSSKQ
jgi:hypothetical protein